MPKNPEKIVQPIDADFDDVTESMVKGATPKRMRTSNLSHRMHNKGASEPPQTTMFGIELERNINGIDMGVMSNGIAYLSQRGLQRIVGVTRKKLFDIAKDWEDSYESGHWDKGRISFIMDRLSEEGFMEPRLYISIIKGGTEHHAYPDVVCMAILEYYAFEAGGDFPKAVEHYRKFARYGLQNFIYDSIGYRPVDSWKHYHDRASILQNASPVGYWIVYNEVTGIILDLINANLPVSEHTIPDISVGSIWGTFWRNNDLESVHGERVKCDHSYPDYYDQAASNPQEIWAYPESAIAEFRRWLREEYLPTKFPAYILRKANVLPGGKNEARQIAGI